MGILIENQVYSIMGILINVNYYKKRRRFRIYHSFPNSLVILNKYFSPCAKRYDFQSFVFFPQF